MSNLIEDLRSAAEHLSPSEVPSLNELAGVVGALISHIEHGGSVGGALVAAGEQAVADVAPAAESIGAQVAADVFNPSSPHSPQGTPAGADTTSAPAASPAPVSEQQQIAELERQLQAQQTLIAQLQRGTVQSTPAG